MCRISKHWLVYTDDNMNQIFNTRKKAKQAFDSMKYKGKGYTDVHIVSVGKNLVENNEQK